MHWFLLFLGCPIVTADYLDEIQDKDGDGYAGLAFDGTDCNDEDPAVHPGATEDWGNDIDDNCDGNSDDRDEDGVGRDLDCDDQDPDVGEQVTYYVDADGDGFGAQEVVGGCEPAPGQVRIAEDCDDTRPDINPSAPERCDPNDEDEDCDDLADNTDLSGPAPLGQQELFVDLDGDGFGVGKAVLQCEDEAWTLEAGDCDDADEDQFPGAVWYVDIDGDDHGDPSSGIGSCTEIAGRIPVAGDCNDRDPTIYEGAPDMPYDFRDSDCGDDSEVDGDGDGLPDPMPTWWPDWQYEGDPCPVSPAQHLVGTGHPFGTIQEAIDQAGRCDTILVHDGTYSPFVVTVEGLVVVAAPGSQPRIDPGVAVVPSASVVAPGVVLSGLTFEGGTLGLAAEELVLVEQSDFRGMVVAISSESSLVTWGVDIEQVTTGIETSGPSLTLARTTFTDVDGLNGVVAAAHPFGLFVLYDVVFERCSGGFTPIVVVDSRSLSVLETTWIEPESAVLGAYTTTFAGSQLEVFDGLSVGNHFFDVVYKPIADDDPFWPPEDTKDPDYSPAAYLEYLYVNGHLWWPVQPYVVTPTDEPALISMDHFPWTYAHHLVLRGNTLLDRGTGAPVWLRSVSSSPEQEVTRLLHNIEVSTSPDFTAAGAPARGVGVQIQAGAVQQATVVGLDVALWPLLGTNVGSGQLTPPGLTDAIAWRNQALLTLLDFHGATAQGPPFPLRVATDDASGVCTTCFSEEPRFLRFDEQLPAAAWDLRLRRDSPYYRYGEAVDLSPTCNSDFAVELQLGAFGNRFGFLQPDLQPYDDCDDDSVGDGMYDTWEWEFLALEPNAHDDGDLLTNLEEFEAGTIPTLSDTDGDGVLDHDDVSQPDGY